MLISRGMQSPSGVTINAGQLYSSSSMFWRVSNWLSRRSLFQRIRRRAAFFGLIAIAAVVGPYTLSARFVKVFSATTYIRIPAQTDLFWPSGTGVEPTASEAGSLARASQTLFDEATKGAPAFLVRSTALKLTLAPNGSKVLVSVTSPSGQFATAVANRAGKIAVQNDREQWLKEVLLRKPSIDSSLLSANSVPEIVQEATSETVFPQTLLQFTGGHVLGRVAIVAMCLGLALVTLLLPESQSEAIKKLLPGSRARSSNLDFEMGDMDVAVETPEIAFYRFPALGSHPGMQALPTLEITDAMRSWLTGHTQTDQLHAREFVVARSSGDGYLSRAATYELARQAAALYLDVVVIDADLSGSYSEREGFQFPDMNGLSDVLMNGAALEDCLLEDDQLSGLIGLSAGRFPSRSDEETDHALDSNRLLDVLDKMGSQADVVIIHGPAIRRGSGANTLGLRADGVVLVADHTSGPIDEQMIASRIVQRAGGNLIGVLTIEMSDPSSVAEPVIA